MKVVIIGSGNVATIMGRLMIKNNIRVVEVMSRNIEHARLLSKELGCNFSDLNGKASVEADLYLLAMSDDALSNHLDYLPFTDKIVVHTAGAVSKDILKHISAHYGVLYPLQTLRKEMMQIPEIPLLIDAGDDSTLLTIRELASKISSHVQFADDLTRQKIHVAAVFVNNFTNHLYQIAESFCQKEKVDFDLLKPLIMETAARVKAFSPAEIQTGPAKRNDMATVNKHLQLLNEYPEWKEIYLKLSNSILDNQR